MRDGLLRSAYSLHRAGNFAEAARLYGELLRTDPEHYDAMYLLGFAQLQAERFEEAERTLAGAMTKRLPVTTRFLRSSRTITKAGITVQSLGSCFSVTRTRAAISMRRWR